MSLPKQYNTNAIQTKWYNHWQSQGFFTSQPNPTKSVYAIVMPPPNVTGILHLGHVLNNTIQDILVRKARMQGKETCWVPGIDHAAIATEAKVMAMLQAKGIRKKDLTREEFLAHAWKWKEKYGRIIFSQLKQLGISCDWERTCFTLDSSQAKAVAKAFVTLYEKGYIYRGTRMIHWDPKGQTALADEEVIYQQVQGKLYYIRYALVEGGEGVTIATTRPETLLGDTALCIHPTDERYHHLKGKQASVPLLGRHIPIIADNYVDKEMGTGCLKVTPAHDPNDYAIGQRHNLPTIDIFAPDGTLNSAAGLYIGEDRMVARKKIVQELKRQGMLEKVVPHTHQVGFSERTQAIVEPKISTQWFIKMKDLAAPALASVHNGDISFHPKRFQSVYKVWMENIRDWCISRQLWWGHPIPVYYLKDGTTIAATSPEQALEKAQTLTKNPALTSADLHQDKDVLDTWFSSWLWPISVFEGIQKPNNETFKYYYPTQDLVTGPDIIFFWVARMIMAGHTFTGIPPFKNVYFTGIVRDKQGKKMSKSLGNSPDPIELIKKYSADGVRVGMLFCVPAGNDLLFEEKLCIQGHHFAHKIWHALRLVKSWETAKKPPSVAEQTAIKWFEARYQQVLQEVNKHFTHFRISNVLTALYKLVWDDFCAHYLEMIKPPKGIPMAEQVYTSSIYFFEQLIKLLHPFMPFITEEVWHQLQDRGPKESICVASWPQQTKNIDKSLLTQATQAFELITHIRHLKHTHHHTSQKALSLTLEGTIPKWLTRFSFYITKKTKITTITTNQNQSKQGLSFIIGKCAFRLPEIVETQPAEAKQNLEEKLAYQKSFLMSIEKKLDNQKFVANAPKHLVARERKKKQNTKQRIAILEKALGKK